MFETGTNRIRSYVRDASAPSNYMHWLFPVYSLSSRFGNYPLVNIWSNNDEAVVVAEVPGLELDDIEISVEGQTLTLSGIRKSPDQGDGKEFHRRERADGSFKRNIGLPFDIDPDKVEANYNRGVLKVRLPRHEKDKPRKIELKSQ